MDDDLLMDSVLFWGVGKWCIFWGVDGVSIGVLPDGVCGLQR